MIVRDKDLGAFYAFYEQRLRDELSAAAADPRRSAKIRGDLAPRLFAEAVAAHGAMYDIARMRVRFVVDAEHLYDAELEVIPASGQLVADCGSATCTESNRTLPAVCVETCAVSKVSAAKHLMVTSEESGRRALPRHAVKCGVSNKLALIDEVARSDVSGTIAVRRFLAASPIGGRLGLAQEFGRCEMTGAAVLADELAVSEVSHRRYRRDEWACSSVSNAVGHVSEFVRCALSGQTLLPTEVGKSDVSGRTVRRDLLVRSQKPPGRWGTSDEMRVCAASGLALLSDEVGISAASGKVVDLGLMTASGRSGRPAMPSELLTCEHSGIKLLPQEAGRCEVSGKLVDDRLLRTSGLSGRRAMAEHTETCAATATVAIVGELETCGVTGQRVVPNALETCAVSGTRARRDRMLRSDISRVWLIPAHAVKSADSKRVCSDAEAVTCCWRGVRLLPGETGTCRRTGLVFTSRLLNADREFSVLRKLLDGTTAGDDAMDLVPWLREQDKALKAAKLARCVRSDDGTVMAVCAESSSWLGWLGGTPRYVGLLISRSNGKQRVLGKLVAGRRINGVWYLEV